MKEFYQTFLANKKYSGIVFGIGVAAGAAVVLIIGIIV